MMKLVNSWVNEMLRKAFISGAKVDDWLNKAKRGKNQVRRFESFKPNNL